MSQDRSSYSSLITHHSSLIYRAAAGGRFAAAAFGVGVVGGDVVHGYLFAGPDVSEGEEEDVAVEVFHVGVGGAGVVDVVGAVAADRAVEAPIVVEGADAVLPPPAHPARHLVARDALAFVLG